MKKIKDILEKIKNFLKRLLLKKDILLISENNSCIQENIEGEEITTNDIEIEKRDFFEIYKNVKNGIVSMDNLMIDDLIKVLLMMKSEVLMYDDKIECSESDIIDLETEIKILERENESMILNLQNQQNIL